MAEPPTARFHQMRLQPTKPASASARRRSPSARPAEQLEIAVDLVADGMVLRMKSKRVARPPSAPDRSR
jgi:hypothetical protein